LSAATDLVSPALWKADRDDACDQRADDK